MQNFKDKFLTKIENKIENKGSKKFIENLVVFVIILIATIIFINYIWNGDKKKVNTMQSDISLAESTNTKRDNNNLKDDSSLERQLENILRKLNGVDDVHVLITYEETNKVIPMYNEDNQQSVTQEEDNRWSV